MMGLMAGLAAALATGGAVRLEERTVIKSRVYLVKEPSFLGARASRTLERGEKLSVETPGRGSWMVAHVGQEQGYIHLSYLNHPPASYTLSGKEVKGESLVSREYNLAVGGFTEQVEREWREEHPDVAEGFRRLDAFMPPPSADAEPATPAPESAAAFALESHLRLPGASDGPTLATEGTATEEAPPGPAPATTASESQGGGR